MRELPVEPSFLLQAGFIVLVIGIVLAASFYINSRAFWIGSILWVAVTGIVGASGVLSDFSGLPPRISILFFACFLTVIILAFSRFGGRLSLFPLSVLIGYQSFRILVEILIHRAAMEGVAPPQMSWSGINFDVASGVSAFVLFSFANRLPGWVILIWNTVALGLLLWVVGVAVLSFPSEFQKLKPDNIWVAHFPFIWLPTVAVTFALLGHLIVFRKVLGFPKSNGT